jgi:hypothetical protein
MTLTNKVRWTKSSNLMLPNSQILSVLSLHHNSSNRIIHSDLDPESDVWMRYKSEANDYDTVRFRDWESRMDTLMIVVRFPTYVRGLN